MGEEEGQRIPLLAVKYHPECLHLLRIKVMSGTINKVQKGLSMCLGEEQ